MKKITFKTIVALFILIVFSTALAFGQQDGFSDIFGAEGAEGSSEDSDFMKVIISGEIGVSLKTFLDDGVDSDFSAIPQLNLDIIPSAGDLEGLARLKLDGSDMDSNIAVEDILEELYLRYFFSAGYIEAGLKKVEWGKGDGIHVIDPINPLNQSDGVVPDINEMKDPVNMVKLNFYLGANGLIELVYLPIFKGYTIADEGRWALVDMAELPNLTIREIGGLSGSTAALRYTTSLGAFDLGIQYYYGYKPEPGYKIETELTGPNPYDPADYTISTELVYTRAHLFGLEAGAAAGPFTFRAEAGYWLTEDLDGDQPELYNNSMVFLAGVDFTIPGTTLFVSLQATESYVLDYKDLTATDVDFLAAYDDKPTTTSIIPAVDFPFAREKFKLRLGGIYLVEANGWMAAPELFCYPVDDMEISLSGQFFGGEKDSFYKIWKDNGNISLGFKYVF